MSEPEYVARTCAIKYHIIKRNKDTYWTTPALSSLLVWLGAGAMNASDGESLFTVQVFSELIREERQLPIRIFLLRGV